MGQILQLAGIVLEGAVLFYFLSDGILKRKRLALYVILYLLATFFWPGHPSPGPGGELIYFFIIVIAGRAAFRKEARNASVYSLAFMSIRHLGYAVIYFAVLSISGVSTSVLQANPITSAGIYVFACVPEMAIIYFLKKYFHDFLETKDEKAVTMSFFGGWFIWALCMSMENRLLDIPVPETQKSVITILAFTVAAVGLVLLGYYFYNNSQKTDAKAEEREMDILKKYGIEVGSLKNEEIDRVLEQIFQDKTRLCQETGIQLQRDGDFSFLEKIGTENAILLIDSLIEYAMSVCKESGKEENHISVIGKDAITRIRCECSCDREFLKDKKPSKQQNLVLRTVSNIASKNKGWVKQENKRGCLIITIKLELP